MAPRCSARLAVVGLLALVGSVSGCASGADSDAVLGDTADLTPANAGLLPGDLGFAAIEVEELEVVCDAVDRTEAGALLGGEVAAYVWADGECVFEVTRHIGDSGGDAVTDRVVVAMLASDGGAEDWRATRKMVRLTDAIEDVDDVGDAAFFAPLTAALFVNDGAGYLLFQYVSDSAPVPDDLAGVLTAIARTALDAMIDR